jgi:hypothetical protein
MEGNSYLGDYFDSQAIPDSSFCIITKHKNIWIK